MEYLLFRLYGPLASWGEIAVGASRHTASYPSKSALIGLLAAACGIKREDEKKQSEMAEGYRFAVKVITTGSLLRDYHTTQVPDSVGNFSYCTRRDELVIGKKRLSTILSSREYRCDALSLVAVWIQNNSPYSLKELEENLQKPKYHLYLGRKSCPLAAPLNPCVITAKGFGQALDDYSYGPLYISSSLLGKAKKEQKSEPLIDSPVLSGLSWDDNYALSIITKQQFRYYWEGEAGDLTPQQTLTRYDQPISRNRWQFTRRMENLLIKEGDQCISQE